MDVLRKFEGVLVGIDNVRLDAERLDTLKALLIQLFGHDLKAEFFQRFRSKKNIVIHLGIRSKTNEAPVSLVAKLFVTGFFENEIAILRKCHDGGVPVPQVLAAENGVILMDFIPGETLTEQVNKTFDSKIIDNLAKWYYKFHKITGVVKEDPRLRNFICNENILFGLDFEEAHEGHWIIDVAGASASLFDTDPIYDVRKRALAWQLLESYLDLLNLERDSDIDSQFIEKIADTLEKTSHWRQDTGIKTLAERIRRDGIIVE